MFLVGPPKPEERGQTKREKLVLQEWGFCGWVGNPPKENNVLISKDAQPWTSADQMTKAGYSSRQFYTQDRHHSEGLHIQSNSITS